MKQTIKKSISIDEILFNTLVNKLGTSSPTKMFSILAEMYIKAEILNQETEVNVKPPFKYMGQKNNRLCKEIKNIESQVKYTRYVEPFGGSLAVFLSLNLDNNINIIVNDIDGRLTNFYKVVKEDATKFLIACDKLPYSAHVFEYVKKQKIFESNLEDAVAYFYEKFASFYSGSTFHVEKEKNTAKHYRENLKLICLLSKRLENVTIINKDFKDVIKKYDSEDTLFYVDSPYWNTESYYTTKVFTKDDHLALSNLLKAINGKFIYSCRSDTNVYKLYRSNKHYALNIRYSVNRLINGEQKKKRVCEKLICNFSFSNFKENGQKDVRQYK